MATYKNTDKIISHLNDEIEACGNPDGNNEPITYGTMLGLISARAFIETAETADVQEVRRGRWVKKEYYIDGEESICMVCCHCGANQVAGLGLAKYCYMCGAKMDRKE